MIAVPGHHRCRCSTCVADRRLLTNPIRPAYESLPFPVRVVDLFSGCGGMSLGVAEAARDARRGFLPALAVDFDADATDVYRANFPAGDVRTADVSDLFDGRLGAEPTIREHRTLDGVRPGPLRAGARIDFLIGGPPCQGHSDLNNNSRRSDPRNGLYLRMVRAAEVLRPRAVLIENVPAVRHATEGVVQVAEEALANLGYTVAHEVIDVSLLGVPQTRRRHVMVALEKGAITASAIMTNVRRPPCSVRTVRWAIFDLLAREGKTLFDTPAVASETNRRRMAWFFAKPDSRYDLPDHLRPPCHRDKSHTYKSVYGRLHWDAPAQTITTGFTSMGQGRYVHPARPRTLTPHEAARLQGFPDFFTFGATTWRTAWSKLIGNAVPPPLSKSIAAQILEVWSAQDYESGAARAARA